MLSGATSWLETDMSYAVESGDPLITVIILTYNRLVLLRKAIESVQSQTLSDWELVIVDDGSTDGTVEAIRNMNDSRIRVLARQHIGLLGVLRNEGVAVAKGKWLANIGILTTHHWLNQSYANSLKSTGTTREIPFSTMVIP